MSLPKRVVESPPQLPSNPTFDILELFKTAQNADPVTRHMILIQLNRTIEQLAQLSLFANEIVSDIANTQLEIESKTNAIKERIDNVYKYTPALETTLAQAKLGESMTYERYEWKQTPKIMNSFFTKESDPYPLRAVYEKCAPPPNVDILDEFRIDDMKCMRFYSYPEFFFDEWRRLEAKKKK